MLNKEKDNTVDLVDLTVSPSGQVLLTDTSLSLVLDEDFHRVGNVEKRKTWSRNS